VSVAALLSCLRLRWVLLVSLVVVAVSYPFNTVALATATGVVFRVGDALWPGGKSPVIVMTVSALCLGGLLHFGVFVVIAWLVVKVSAREARIAKGIRLLALAFFYTVAVFVSFLLMPHIWSL
jgi:hypothetical protein